MSSAQSQALRLPEIIASIFDAVCRDSRWQHFKTLLACTLVNKLWHDEANRRLWDHCGESTDHFNIPTLENLLALDKSKQQKFANYIRCIFVSYPDLSGVSDLSDSDDDNDSDDGPEWKGRFLPQLAGLSFPRLEELDMDAPMAHDTNTYPTPVLTQFAQPNLRRIRISATASTDSFGASEQWFIELSKRSQGLIDYCYANEAPQLKVSPAVFTSFLKNMRSLESLEWRSDISEDAFMILATKATLRKLKISLIADDWLRDQPHVVTPGGFFQNLVNLDCKISANGLDKLISHLVNLRKLSLTVINGTSGVIRTLGSSRLANLDELRLEAHHGDVINAADLLAFAKSSPQLSVLDLAKDLGRYDIGLPTLQDFDDGTIKDLAGSLPLLKEIRLVSRQNTDMTEESLLFLGRHCYSLEVCSLTAIIDYNNLVSKANSIGIRWEKLKRLAEYGFGGQPEEQTKMQLLVLARDIRAVMSSLQNVSLELHRDLQGALNQSPRNII